MSEVDSDGGWLTKILMGCLWALIFGGLTVLGGNVIANDRRQSDALATVNKDVAEVKADVRALETGYRIIDKRFDSIESKIDWLIRNLGKGRYSELR